LIQAASQVQDTGGGSYLTRSYAVSQAQEAGPTGLHFVQSVGQWCIAENASGSDGEGCRNLKASGPLVDWHWALQCLLQGNSACSVVVCGRPLFGCT
jgi:hypothetical protein